MYLSENGSDEENVRNRGRFFDEIGFSGKKSLLPDRFMDSYGARSRARPGVYFPRTDVLITCEKDIALSVTGADCYLIYFEDHAAGVIGLAHAGWRGIVGGIIENVVSGMIAVCAELGNIGLRVGPGICARHFEVRRMSLVIFRIILMQSGG